MHDIYAFGLGLYTLILTILLTEFLTDKLTLLMLNPPQIRTTLKESSIRFLKWVYLVAVTGVALPLLCGACLDLYVMMPFKRLVSPEMKIEMAVMQDWAFGIIHLKIAGRVIMYLDGRLAQAMRQVVPRNPRLSCSSFPPSDSPSSVLTALLIWHDFSFPHLVLVLTFRFSPAIGLIQTSNWRPNNSSSQSFNSRFSLYSPLWH